MWVEMIESVRASELKPSLCVPPPANEIEVRFVVWTTKDVKTIANDNTITNVQITFKLDCHEYSNEYDCRQPTDVHYGSTGNAIFNWRILYPRIRMPTKSATVQINLEHHELLGNTFIGSLDLDIKRYLEKVSASLDALTIGPSELAFQDKDTMAAGGGEGEGDQTSAEPPSIGSVVVTMWIMTSVEAEGRKVGIARDEPNEDPQLLTPTEGRDWGSYLATWGFGWPDFGLWKKLIPVFVAMVLFLFALVAMKQIGLL